MRISDYLFPREGERQYTVGTHTYRNTQSKSKYAQHTKHTPTVPHNSKSQASPNNHLHNQSIADENVYCASQFTIDGHSALRNSTHLNTHTHTPELTAYMVGGICAVCRWSKVVDVATQVGVTAHQQHP